MIAREPGRGSIRSADGAELLSDVLGMLVHDLGGVTAALDLRAEALAAGGGRDGDALRAIAAEVRDAARIARLLRGPQGGEALAPGRGLTVSGWWRLVSRVTRALLPRGTVVHATFAEEEITPREGTALAYAWLAACKDVASSGLTTPPTVSIEGRAAQPDGGGVLIAARCDHWPPDRAAAGGRWHRFAGLLPGIVVDWWSPDGAGARWSSRTTADG